MPCAQPAGAHDTGAPSRATTGGPCVSETAPTPASVPPSVSPTSPSPHQPPVPASAKQRAERVETRVVMDADQISRACARMAHQILEANRGAENLMLLGIPTRGVQLAHRLAAAMSE